MVTRSAGIARPPEMDAQPSNIPQDLDNMLIAWPGSMSPFGGLSDNGTRAPGVDFQRNSNAGEACSVEGNAHVAVTALDNQQQREAPACGPWKRKRKRDSNWTQAETSVLVGCKEEAVRENGSRFCKKGKPTWTDWVAIAGEIQKKLRTTKTGKQCRVRWETLVRSYQEARAHCTESDEEFSEVTEEENQWYEVIDQYYRPTPRKARAERRDDLGGGGDGRHLTSPESCPPGWRKSSEAGKSWRKQVAIPGFNALGDRQRSILFALVNCRIVCPWRRIMEWSRISDLCEWLSTVLKRNVSEISCYVNALVKKKLLHIRFFNGDVILNLNRLSAYVKFVKKVVSKNPDLDIYRRLDWDYNMSTLESSSLPQGITTLVLSDCTQLVEADLRNLRKLRCLVIRECDKLEVVNGWEQLGELGWLEISACHSYRNYPTVQCLPSLQRYVLDGVQSSQPPSRLEPEMSRFVRLCRLEVYNNQQLKESGDLSSLKCLQVLLFWNCSALSTIRGLSGLHSLTELDLKGCKALSDLGHRKASGELDMLSTGVEVMADLGHMKALVKLIKGCKALSDLGHRKASGELDMLSTGVEVIADLGHMKALVKLNIRDCPVEEIVGLEELVSLERLSCSFSKLKRLPDLHHLPRLQVIDFYGTPFAEDPSSIYFGKSVVKFNDEERYRWIEHVEVSDVSDSEHGYFDSEEGCSDLSDARNDV